MSIKVMPVLSNALFEESIRKLIEGFDGIEAMRPAGTVAGGTLRSVEALRPDVVVVDIASLYRTFADLAPPHALKLILIDTFCGQESIMSSVIAKGIRGVLPGGATPDEFERAIREVSSGEVWLEELDIKALLTGIHSIGKPQKSNLSEREWEVVELVGQGFRNKEIAERLCISEPTVKTYLSRIFHKLDIKNRPQLINFALKRNGPGARQA